VDDVVTISLRETFTLIWIMAYAIQLQRRCGRHHAFESPLLVPVLRYDGAVVSVISFCGPVERFHLEVETCAGHLLDITGALSTKLGHRG
jgi:hypothetical protein